MMTNKGNHKVILRGAADDYQRNSQKHYAEKLPGEPQEIAKSERQADVFTKKEKVD